jgi:pathogenesis-related protein 1
MRIATVLVSAALTACAGDDGAQTTDDGGDGDGASGPVDGGPDAPPPANEPAGLVGTVAAHNAARAEVGLPPLTWDPALAAIADAWVRQCRDTEAPTGLVDHNAGRSQGYPTYVGENIYGASGQASGTAATASWVAEKANYNYAANSCSGVCGHYTQVVWRETTKVGCAIYTCPGLRYGSTVVCNYAPGGNVGGRRPY